ncbi:hypothetical protein QFC19_004118 [Naganishia cerealis]|uniref:Uncharacterized protein n=1 Tax=Naganishia cerealis TaxID=610337 RepID=A0ACC2VYI8_9TREE|nr:hypothetical protein QFC19_004118 [Naganishia cerealis]
MSPAVSYPANSAALLLQQAAPMLPPGAGTGYVVQPAGGGGGIRNDPHRRPSQRSSRHPSISEEPSIVPPPLAAASMNPHLGRSKSWRQPADNDDWRYNGAVPNNMRLSRGVSTSASENNHTYHYGQGHHRSSSYTTHLTGSDQESIPTTSPLDPTFAVHPPRPAGGLHKSASLRSNTSQSSNANSSGHGHGAYARSLLTRGRISPGNGTSAGSLTWDHLSSPTFAKSEDNHAIQTRRIVMREDDGARDGSNLALTTRGISGPILGIGQGVGASSIGYTQMHPQQQQHQQQQQQNLMQQSIGADVKRHQSLQQGFGHSTKVQERLARSQALLPPEQRTSAPLVHATSPVATSDRDRRLSDIASSSSARNVWSTNLAGADVVNDGWEQVDHAMRARLNHTPVNLPGPTPPTTSLSRQHSHTPPTVQQGNVLVGDQLYSSMQQDSAWADPSYHSDFIQRDSLSQAFQAMQLGTEMLIPASGPINPASQLSSHPLMPATAMEDLYRNGLVPYGVPRAHPIAPGAYADNMDYNSSYGRRAQAASPVYPGFPTTSGQIQSSSVPLLQGTAVMPPAQQHSHQHHHQHSLQQPATQAVPNHIARAAEAEVQLMIAKRGLNPYDFGCQPENARFFVIKSFTEDDVHKSLKHEIWASTTYGNQRLDKAFAEAQGPVYLFFSVNGSGHFCGVAQMLSPVDYNQTSTVWAQDKWKGIFKLRWIFVKDIPNGALRHIRLMNTPEQKPITNSRDTQELLWEAGCEVLSIFVKFKEKTSLLQDWGFHEMQALEKAHKMTIDPSREGQNMPPLPNPARDVVDSRATGGYNYADEQQQRAQIKAGGLVKGFSATGPPSLANQHQGFSVVSRGTKAATKIF